MVLYINVCILIYSSFTVIELITFEAKEPLMVYRTLQFSSKLPFIKPVEVLQVSSKNKEYYNDSLGLCIDVPEGAVPEGSLLQLEVGMCLYGPFKFPGGLYPIAPILMLCPQKYIKLAKPLRVTLPHNVDDAKDSDVGALGIEVIKADHTSLLNGGECIFDNVISDSNISFTDRNDFSVVTFSLSHFCFVTLRATTTSEIAERTGYCICPLYPPLNDVMSGDFMYHLCVTYYMPPCLEVTLH